MTGHHSWQGTTLRRKNYTAVLRTILAEAPISRSEIARQVGLTPTAITSIITSLNDAGLVSETQAGSASRDRGRPRIPLSIDPAGPAVLGVHIGGLYTTVGLIDLTGHPVEEAVLPHSADEPAELIHQAVDALRNLISTTAGGRAILGVGASIGGWVDVEHGTVIDHTRLRWAGVPLRDMLHEQLQLPVVLNNNARAMALLESWLGAASNTGNFLYMSIGAVAGSAVVIDREPYNGPDSAAGSIEHLSVRARTSTPCHCGRRDCLQASTSDETILQLAHQSGVSADVQSIHDLAKAADNGNTVAARLLRRRAQHVGHAIGQLVDLLNPELIILGGSILDAPTYLDHLRRAAATTTHTTRNVQDIIVASAFGNQSLARASGALMLDAYYRDPLAYPPLAST